MPMNAGYSPIPNRAFLRELEDAERRDGFVAAHLRTRLALLIRALREQNGWSQAELGRRLGKPQSVVSRLEDPDYGRLSLQTLFEVAAVFKLPLYIDMPNWDEWFRLMAEMSGESLRRQGFDVDHLVALANVVQAGSGVSLATITSNEQTVGEVEFPAGTFLASGDVARFWESLYLGQQPELGAGTFVTTGLTYLGPTPGGTPTGLTITVGGGPQSMAAFDTSQIIVGSVQSRAVLPKIPARAPIISQRQPSLPESAAA